MDKRQTAVILEIISTMYQNKFKVENKQLLLDLWHDALKDHDFQVISENLKEYYKTNKFPPSVAELIEQPDKEGRYIPGVEETKRYLLEKEQERQKALADPSIEE